MILRPKARIRTSPTASLRDDFFLGVDAFERLLVGLRMPPIRRPLMTERDICHPNWIIDGVVDKLLTAVALFAEHQFIADS